MMAAERAQQIKTITVGKHQIEQDDVERPVGQVKKRAVQRMGDRDLECFVLKPAPERIGYFGFVFNHQGTHAGRLAQPRRTRGGRLEILRRFCHALHSYHYLTATGSGGAIAPPASREGISNAISNANSQSSEIAADSAGFAWIRPKPARRLRQSGTGPAPLIVHGDA